MALTGKIQEVTRQDGGQIGNALKTILSRTSRSKSADENVTAAERSDAAKALEKFGISIYDGAGNYTDFSETLSRIVEKLPEMTDAERANLAESMGGVRNINTVLAMFDKWNEAQELAKEARENPDFIDETQAKAMESISSHLESFKTSVTGIWDNLVDTGAVNLLIDSGTTLVNVFNSFLEVAKQIGTLFGLIPGDIGKVTGSVTQLALAFGVLSKGQSLIKNFINKNGEEGEGSLIGNLTKRIFNAWKTGGGTQGGNRLQNIGKAVSDELQTAGANTINSMKNNQMAAAMKGALSGFEGMFSNGVSGFFTSFKTGFTTLFSTINSGLASIGISPWAVAAVAAIGLVSLAVNKLGTTLDEVSARLEKSTSNFVQKNNEIGKSKKHINSLSKEFNTLSKGISETGQNVSLIEEDFARYQEIANEIGEAFENAVAFKDIEGNVVLNADIRKTSDIDKYAFEEQQKNAQAYLYGSNEDGFKDLYESTGALKDLRKQIDLMKGELNLFDSFKAELNQDDPHYKDKLDAVTKWSEKYEEAKESSEKMLALQKEINDTLNARDSLEKGLTDAPNANLAAANELMSNEEYVLLKKLKDEDGTFDFQAITDAQNNLKAYQNKLAENEKAVMTALLQTTDITDFKNLELGGLEALIKGIDKIDKSLLTENFDYSGFVDKILEISDTSKTNMDNITKAIEGNADKDVRKRYVNFQDNIQPLYNQGKMLENGKLWNQDQVEAWNDMLGYDEQLESLSLYKAMLEEIGKKYSENTRNLLTTNDYIRSLGRTQDHFNDKTKEGADKVKDMAREYDNLTDFINSRNLGLDDWQEMLDLLKECKGNFDDFAEAWAAKNWSEIGANDRLKELEANLKKIAEDIAKTNASIKESFSGTGLQPDALNDIKNIYKDIKGYDPSKLFQNTALGVRMNMVELNKLRSSYEKLEMNKYINQYKDLQAKLNDLSYKYVSGGGENSPSATAVFEAQRDIVLEQMQQADEQISMLRGLTNSYQKWVEARTNGEAGDVYTDIATATTAKSNETVSDIEQMATYGLIGTQKFRSWLNMFIDENKDAMTMNGAEIQQEYQGALEKAKKYFTYDPETGYQTAQGTQAFFDELVALGKAQKIGDTYDFSKLPKTSEIADLFGMKESTVEAIFQNATDFAFDMIYKNLSDPKTVAKEAMETAKKKYQERTAPDTAAAYTDALNVQQTDEKTNKKISAEQLAKENKLLTETFESLDDKNKIGLDADNAVVDSKKLKDSINDIAKAEQLLIAKQKELGKQLSQISKESDPQKYAETKSRIDNVTASLEYLNSQKKYEIELLKEYQNTYNYASDAGRNQLEAVSGSLNDRLNKNKAASPVEIDWGREDSGYYSTKLEELTGQLEKLGLYKNNKLNVEAEGGEEALIVITQLNQAIADMKNNPVRVDTSQLEGDKKELADSFNEILDEIASFNASKATAEITGNLDDTQLQNEAVKAATKIQNFAKKQAIKFNVGDTDISEIKVDTSNAQKIIDAFISQNPKIVSELDLDTTDALTKLNEIMKGDRVITFNVTIKDNLTGKIESSKEITVTATTEGKEDVDELHHTIMAVPDADPTVNCETFGRQEVERLRGVIEDLPPDKRSEVEAIVDGFEDVLNLRDALDSINDVHVTVGANLSSAAKKLLGVGHDDWKGTAHAEGTAHAHGKWTTGTSGKALVGELGQELLVRNGKYQTIGDKGPEFINTQPDDIIFNHMQTKEILRNGHITTRAANIDEAEKKALSKSYKGTAFAGGSFYYTHSGGPVGSFPSGISYTPVSFKKDTSSNKNNNNNNKNNKDKDEKEEKPKIYDYIEIFIDRIERKIEHIDKIATSSFKNLNTRMHATSEEFSMVTSEISSLKKAASAYLDAANSVPLDSYYRDLMKQGALFTGKIYNEDIQENIDEYKEWYDKYLDVLEKIDEAELKLGELTLQRFQLVADDFDNQLDAISTASEILSTNINMLEETGRFVGRAWYEEAVNRTRAQANMQNQALREMERELNKALSTGAIDKYSESYYEMVSRINEMEKAWHESRLAMKQYYTEYIEMMKQAHSFEIEQIDSIVDEKDFMIELLSVVEDNLYDKATGRLSNVGNTVGALHAEGYALAMAEAQKYNQYAKQMEKELANDPHNTKLIQNVNEYREAQRDSIKTALEEKKSLQSLVSGAYDRMLDVMSDLIKKRKELNAAQKDTYTYGNTVRDKTKEVSSLQKQVLAIKGDDSEEAKARLQKATENLARAERDLAETQYDRWIADQEQMMDLMYQQYELILAENRNHVDEFMDNFIDYANTYGAGGYGYQMGLVDAINGGFVAVTDNNTINSESVYTTISQACRDVGYHISDANYEIWNNEYGALGDISRAVKEGGTSIIDSLSGIGSVLRSIQSDVSSYTASKVSYSSPSYDSGSGFDYGSNYSYGGDDYEEVYYGDDWDDEPERIVISDYDDDDWGEEFYDSDDDYYNSYGLPDREAVKEVYQLIHTGQAGNEPYRTPWLRNEGYSDDEIQYGQLLIDYTYPYYLNGWQLDESDAWRMMGYSHGGLVTENGVSYTHAGEQVLTPEQTKAFSELVYNLLPKIQTNPAGFTAGNNIRNNINNELNMTVNLPNVQDATSFAREMQTNKQIQDMIRSMTVDLIVGKNKLSKNTFKF